MSQYFELSLERFDLAARAGKLLLSVCFLLACGLHQLDGPKDSSFQLVKFFDSSGHNYCLNSAPKRCFKEFRIVLSKRSTSSSVSVRSSDLYVREIASANC